MKSQNTFKRPQSIRKAILMIVTLTLYCTSCGGTPTEKLTAETLQIPSGLPALSATPLPLPSIIPTRTETVIPPTIPPNQTPTLSPQKYFSEKSENWRVAFLIENTNEICVVNGDGSNKVCLTLADEISSQGVYGLDLSPDGTQVAFPTGCNIYIWRIGGEVTSLRDGGGCGSFRELTWSPNGNFIAYISEELTRSCPGQPCQSFFGDVFVDSLDGSVHRPLTADLAGWSYNPDWSPDGRSIAFSHQSVLVVEDSEEYPTILPEEIFVVSLNGNDAINFTNHSAADLKPRWSPDGSVIAFLSNRKGSELLDMYVMNSNGSEVRMVASLALEYYWPYSAYPITWLPDNRFILHNRTLHDTVTGKSDIIRLPFGSIIASWVMISGGLDSLTAHCAEEWSQLRPGIQAVVAGDPDDLPNSVRSEPSTSADIVAQIYPGHEVRVLEGPVCVDGLVFWKVESKAIPGGAGWTAEGDGKEYWLEP